MIKESGVRGGKDRPIEDKFIEILKDRKMTAYMNLTIERENGGIIERGRIKSVRFYNDIFYDKKHLEVNYINKKGKLITKTYSLKEGDEFYVFTTTQSE